MKVAARKKKRKKSCGKGWAPLDIRRNGKTERVCVRFPGNGKKPKGMSWLEAAAIAAGGLAGRRTRRGR